MPWWFITALEKSLVVWQSEHACVVGMWFAGFAGALNVAVVWQAMQSPVAGCVARIGRVTMVTPKKLRPVSWQVAQGIPATAVWFIFVPANVAKAVGEWQASHGAALVGIWVAGADTGTMLANDNPGPWQVAQPLVMAWWLITAWE
jgi:xanthosine utilization system XapX-like protein